MTLNGKKVIGYRVFCLLCYSPYRYRLQFGIGALKLRKKRKKKNQQNQDDFSPSATTDRFNEGYKNGYDKGYETGYDNGCLDTEGEQESEDNKEGLYETCF